MGRKWILVDGWKMDEWMDFSVYRATTQNNFLSATPVDNICMRPASRYNGLHVLFVKLKKASTFISFQFFLFTER